MLLSPWRRIYPAVGTCPERLGRRPFLSDVFLATAGGKLFIGEFCLSDDDDDDDDDDDVLT